MMRKKSQEPMYLHLIRTFVLLIIAVIMITAGLLYFSSQNITNDLTYHASLEALRQDDIRIRSAFSKAQSTAEMIYSDLDISYMLYDRTFKASRLMMAVNRLTEYRRLENNIYSIYIYNGNTKAVSVSASSHGSVENPVYDDQKPFVDMELRNILDHVGTYSRGLPIYRYMTAQESSKTVVKPVYTFFANQNVIGGAFSANVLVNYLPSIFGMEETDGTEMILDADGRVVVGNQHDMLHEFGDEPFWKKICEEDKENGSFRMAVASTEMLITYLNMIPGSGWRLIKMVPYASVSHETHRLRILAIIITSLVLVVGVSISLLWTNRLYVPIRQMNDDLQRTNRENEQLRVLERQQTLRHLLHGDSVEHEKLKVLSLAPIPRTMRLVLWRPRYFKSPDWDEHQLQTKLQLTEQKITDMFSETFFANVTMIGETDLALLLSLNEDHRSEWDLLDSLIMECTEHISSHYDLVLRHIISPMFSSIEMATDYLLQMQDMMFRSLCLGDQEKLYLDESDFPCNENFDYFATHEQQLVSLIQSEQWEQARQLVKSMLGSVCGCSYYIMDMAVSRMRFLLIGALRRINQIHGEPGNVADTEPFELLRMEKTDQLYSYFDDMVNRIETVCHGKKANRFQDIACRVDEILNSSLSDGNLNVDFIAEQIRLSSAYVSKIYKTVSGQSISEKLGMLRIERAKQLLRSRKQLTVTQIAEMTGFTSNTYFSRVFKREIGMTPNEYRLLQEHADEPTDMNQVYHSDKEENHYVDSCSHDK